jgi:hypothetical protein
MQRVERGNTIAHRIIADRLFQLSFSSKSRISLVTWPPTAFGTAIDN